MTATGPEGGAFRASASLLAGEVFGDLTVVTVGLRAKPTPSQVLKHHQGELAAICRCACGTELLVKVGLLMRGRRTDCGCSAAETDCRPERGRRPKPIETAPFAGIVAEFLTAAKMDSSYAVAIANAANVVIRKRMVWALRNQLRDAELEARTACAAAGPSSCVLTAPCGVGLCPFSPGGDLVELADVPAVGRKINATSRATRPQPRPDHVPGAVYTIESCVTPLLELREKRGTLPAHEELSGADYEDRQKERRRNGIEAHRARLRESRAT